MPVATTAKAYADQAPDWELMRDALSGERAIKAAGTRYLPKTSGMLEAEALAHTDSPVDPAQAAAIYNAYRDRAVYPRWASDALRTMTGLVAGLAPEVNLPRELAGMEKRATPDGFGLPTLLTRVVTAILTKGRAVLLSGYDRNGQPIIAPYAAESLLNWKAAEGRLQLAVLQEHRAAPGNDEFSEATEDVFRVLDLDENSAYRVRLMDREERVIDVDYPGLGDSYLTSIPLTVAGTTDNDLAMDDIPLLTMGRAALQYYRLSADYHQALHHTAHPQPVVTGLGEDSDLRVTGPMAAWTLPEGGNAFYMEPSGNGIDALRMAMTDQRDTALEAGARVLDRGHAAESGEARRARQDDQHATLCSVVVQAASAIQESLEHLADWAGATQAPVFKVDPKFSSPVIDSAMLKIAGDLVLAGEAPRSVLYSGLRKAGLTDLDNDQLETQREGGDA